MAGDASDRRTATAPAVRVLRVYDLLDDSGPDTDEVRVLVDRLWPRGVAKARLSGYEWDKDAAPSDDLRKEYHGDDIDRSTFSKRYRAELDKSSAAQDLLDRAREARASTISLLIAGKDLEHSHAQILADHLRSLADRDREG